EIRIVRDFPEMAVGIREIAGIAAPKYRLRRPDDRRARGCGARHCVLDLLPRGAVPGKRDVAIAARLLNRDLGVLRQFGRRPERQDHPAGLEERDALGVACLAPETERLVERRAPRQVADTERQQGATGGRLGHVRTASAAPPHCAAAKNARSSAWRGPG